MTPSFSMGIAQLADAVRAGELSAEAVTEACLLAVRAHGGETGLGAFLTVQHHASLEAAREVDARRARGERLGALAGVPLGVKDSLSTRGAPTTAGSRVLVSAKAATAERDAGAERGYVPPYDATAVARLRAADAILVGKCNQDELAMGSSTENSAFFPCRNPYDTTRAPGGSSGGSAAAVSARLVAGALGSDTGGSIRQPAALTGVVGIKPTYGRVSRAGLIAFASSLDQVGPFALDVRGAARLLDAISGADEADATCLALPPTRAEAACQGSEQLRGLRVGVPSEYFGEGLAPEVEVRVREALDALRGLGATLVPVRLPHTRHALATYYVLATAEASSNLSRFDGVRFGLRVPPAPGADLERFYADTRGRGFGREVKRRILLGTFVLSAGYYDAYYLRAQKVRTLLRRDFHEVFQQVDVVASPVSPTLAFPLGERMADPLSMYLADVYTLPASLAGLPALSVPTRHAEASGVVLPVGLQLVGRPLADEELCRVAHAYERARGPISPPPAMG